MSASHNLAFELFESVATVRSARPSGLHETLNDLLMHPVLGYAILAAVLGGLFALVFHVGSAVEPFFLEWFDGLHAQLQAWLPADTVGYALVHGVAAGVGGGIGIVVPYLLPFFVGLALLEDTGYLPRIVLRHRDAPRRSSTGCRSCRDHGLRPLGSRRARDVDPGRGATG